MIFKSLNATGFRPEWLIKVDKTKSLEEQAAQKERILVKKFGGRTKYNQKMQEVANRLLKRLLGEGSKNVSNVDRLLAQEISGLVKEMATGLFTNKTLLRERLGRILKMANDDIDSGAKAMKGLYGEYSTRVQPGILLKQGSYSERVLKPLVRETLRTRREAPRTELQQQTFGNIPGFSFVDGRYQVDKK